MRPLGWCEASLGSFKPHPFLLSPGPRESAVLFIAFIISRATSRHSPSVNLAATEGSRVGGAQERRRLDLTRASVAYYSAKTFLISTPPYENVKCIATYVRTNQKRNERRYVARKTTAECKHEIREASWLLVSTTERRGKSISIQN